ncbi:MAG: hypothetical protein ACXABY_09625 [Candidatus Thorarchaeota archaeon]|jgi:hypothetical protein
MKKIKYKVTGDFGENNEGDIVDAYILIEGVDNGVALVYHPKSSRYTCASLEFCVEDKDDYWVTLDNPDDNYINIEGQGELNKLAKSVAALKYRRKAQEQVK